MTLTRNVNGTTVILSSVEEAQVRAEWAANPPPQAGPPPPSLQDVLAVLTPDQQATLAAIVAKKTGS
jgi:hypothetical protein